MNLTIIKSFILITLLEVDLNFSAWLNLIIKLQELIESQVGLLVELLVMVMIEMKSLIVIDFQYSELIIEQVTHLF